jgi:hypothetical protein
MLRAIILCLVLLVAFAAVVPIATEHAEAGAEKQQLRKKKKERLAKQNRRYITSRYTKRKSARRYRKSNKSRYTKARKARPAKSKRKGVRRSAAKRKVRRTSRVRSRSATKRYRKKARRGRSAKRSYRKPVRRTATRRTAKKPRVRKYSGRWWRSYRAKQNRRKALAKRKRNMRLRQIRLAKQERTAENLPLFERIYEKSRDENLVVREMPRTDGPAAPLNYVRTVDENGNVVLEVVGPAVGETLLQGRNQTVGGVSTTTLRRTVIDRMIQENGWVENDYTQEIGGQKVYVVVAKSEDRNKRVQAQTFYFTESNGQIYRVSAKAPDDASEQTVKKSEQVIESLQKPGEKRVEQAQNQ